MTENKSIAPAELEAFSRRVLQAAGSDPEEAAVVAQVLVWCDSVGRPNQGVWRLPILCDRLSRGLLKSPCQLQTQMKAACLGSMDGGAGQGHYVAYRAMHKAIELARTEGLAAILVNNSNFYGAGGYYAAMAARENMIGIALSNSFPKVRAAGGRGAVLGTNPLAFACPAADEPALVLDMATSELAGSTVRKRQEVSGDSAAPSVLDPLGGHKGFGLALMVEVLAGVLSGAGFSHRVKSMYNDFENKGDNGHFFMAIDIERLMPLADFHERMGALIELLRASGDAGQVRYPGESRWEALKKTDREGIAMDESTREKLGVLAARLGVPNLAAGK
ncbi:Ldh family oxidoreductase [Proteobacteria bacterium 005FR1]|nr:Ldh family oxidoreductase [Proteobacteria bacterium 005FR1]